MIKVTRTRLDAGAPAVVRASCGTLELAVDDRHITPTGATAIETALNGLAPRDGDDETGTETDC